MNGHKLLYRAWQKEKRKNIRVLGFFSIVLGLMAFFCCTIVILTASKVYIIFMACIGILFSVLGLLFTYLAIAKEFRIYENGISYPKSLGRLFILYPNILEIRLNTCQEVFMLDIEIIHRNGIVLKYPKTELHDWKEFYRVMLTELKDKVKVIE